MKNTKTANKKEKKNPKPRFFVLCGGVREEFQHTRKSKKSLGKPKRKTI
ncbi:hypothetical protein [Endomicrobium proavitum]|nr:hypothetical protein [Endomicrobium proavitum]